ncbi:hypothetical protein [Arthrobacter sp. Cr_A7]|uniref:hypothetical protein n=1 Tax=Arthrobacter sp. Cr_A7 TaxID=3031017 RepID=UPI0023DB981B|nr:hypothetical protein [Arthrobacter sp. Cr_A7]MDF2049582.1 hypothetical protein [Arthrobacter sp. Cr_A7]
MDTIYRTPTNAPENASAKDEEKRLTGMLEVNVANVEELDEALEKAISTIRRAATYYRVGVMVTRTGPGSYVVRAHPEVPYGLIRQQHS